MSEGQMPGLQGRTIHLCVSGGIAAYKAAELARGLIGAGARVRVAMTPNAQRFVGPLTFQALTHSRVLTGTLDPSDEMAIGHIAFAQEGDALVVAPATANLIGKAACGIGDEVVSTVLLAACVPVLLAPAMNTVMYANPAVQANLRRLRARGWSIIEPTSGALACGQVGPGRLAEPADIVAAVIDRLARGRSLAGRSLLVSAGPTREPIDPVRFLSNPSTGKMGWAVAAAAAAAGAAVTLVHGPVALAPLPGIEPVPVTTALEMHAAITARASVDAVVMTAAVADWRPATPAPRKEKKAAAGARRTLELAANPDILAELGARSPRPLLIGFAAETGDPRPEARRKRAAKGVDLMVGNDVSAPGSGFGTDTNRAWLIDARGEQALPLQSKDALAARIVDWIAGALAEREG